MKAMDVDATILARRAKIVDALRKIVPGEGVIEQEAGRRPYESDGLTAYRALPMLVVLPETVAEVQQVLAYCHTNNVKVVARGAGTSLSGGALPLEDGILVSMMKFNKVKEIDFANRFAVVEPGVTNLAITKAVEAQGFYYAPDPSSQIACSIGGNVAENSGGVHCLKYGLFDNFPKTIQHNPRDLPLALAPMLALDHWVCWRWELDSRGKWTKPPYQARNPLWNASSNDPSTWADHDSACKAVEAGSAHGVGFVLTDTPFAAFDLDDCIIEGAADSDWEISPWALQLIKEAGSYVEVTPSVTGLRIIGTAVGNPIHRKFPMPDGGSLEIYRKATRYITVTGVVFDDRLDKLINIDEAVDESVSRVPPIISWASKWF